VTHRPPRSDRAAEARGDAAELARRLGVLEDGPIRVRAAARALAGLPPGRAAHVVSALVRGAGTAERVAARAIGEALADPGGDLSYDHLAAMYADADAEGLFEVTGLLVGPAPRRAWAVPRDRDGRLARITLGHKKAMARTHRDPDLLSRLAAEGEPAVVRELLRNPQVTEPCAVRIASRRPCRPETLALVAQAPRWRARPAVALAVARNPYAPTAVALKLLPSLAAHDLAEIGRDGTVHPLVQALAAQLVERRAGG
jgi:hypothetical protein